MEMLEGIASDLNSIDRIQAEMSRSMRPEVQTGPERVAPVTWVEKRTFQIWVDLLQTEEFGIDDGFLLLGGHSLLGVQMLSRIQARFGVELPMASLFDQNITVRNVAIAIEDGLIEQMNLEPQRARSELRNMTEEEVDGILHGE